MAPPIFSTRWRSMTPFCWEQSAIRRSRTTCHASSGSCSPFASSSTSASASAGVIFFCRRDRARFATRARDSMLRPRLPQKPTRPEYRQRQQPAVPGNQRRGRPSGLTVFARRGCELIFIRARSRRPARVLAHRVASITKSNAQGYGIVLWDEVFAWLSRELPDIQISALLVDRAVIEFVRVAPDGSTSLSLAISSATS